MFSLQSAIKKAEPSIQRHPMWYILQNEKIVHVRAMWFTVQNGLSDPDACTVIGSKKWKKEMESGQCGSE